MAKDPLGWIIFKPENEETGKFIFNIAQAVRLSYRSVVEAGLRNPEADFDPGDYFGYMLPLVIPSPRPDKDMAHVYAFGLAHKDQRPAFDGDSAGKNAHLMSLQEVINASIRLVALDTEDVYNSGGNFPITVHQSKKWTGLKGWMGGQMKVPDEGSLVRFITKYLLMTPVMTDDKAALYAQDLIKKFQGGN
jgi:hypothetical protein